jgi:tellurite resistance protein
MATTSPAVHHVAHDGDLSEEDKTTLSHLRYVLGLDDAEAQIVELDVVRQLFRERLKDALADSHLSDAEKQALESTAHAFGLSDEQHHAI